MQLLPSYKANRRKRLHQSPAVGRFPRTSVERSHKLVIDVLSKCNVPVSKLQILHTIDSLLKFIFHQKD